MSGWYQVDIGDRMQVLIIIIIIIIALLKNKSGVDKIIVKKQPYQLLNISREFFPSFHASNFHKLDD